MIEKPSILITSVGRTGTEFFARLFADLVPDSTSLHEPDIVQNTGVDSRLAHFWRQVSRAGPWRMVVLKALGAWTLVRLSDSRFLGRLDSSDAVRGLVRQRGGFVRSMPGTSYVEANIGYYGLLDITSQVFRQHRAVYIVRDGRDWVRSHMNWGEFYGKRGLRRLISHNWPAASDILTDPYAAEWPRLPRFDRLCWAWSRLNEYALHTLASNPHARLFRFEQIFSGDGRYDVLRDLVMFAVAVPGLGPVRLDRLAGWLERRIHGSAGAFPSYDRWTDAQRDRFATICGPLMAQLGYVVS